MRWGDPMRVHADPAAATLARCAEARRACEARHAELQSLRFEANRVSSRAVAMHRPEGVVAVPQFTPPPPLPPPETPLDRLRAALDEYVFLERTYAQYASDLRARIQHATALLDRAQTEQTAMLGPPPRPVPLTYVLAEFGAGYWVQIRWLLFPPFAMAAFFGALGLVSVFEQVGLVGPGGVVHSGFALGACALLVPLAASPYAVLRASRRLHLLANGEVARIVARTPEFVGGASRNWPHVVAVGWEVTTRTLTGPWRRFELDVMTSRGAVGRVVFRGILFDGVVLADPDDPSRGLPNHLFGSWPRPGADGAWDPRLPGGAWLRAVLGLGLVCAFIAAGAGLTLVPDPFGAFLG